MHMRWFIRRPLIALVAPMLALPLASPASAQATSQATSPLGWSGWARCEVNVQGRGYTDQQTHTWVMGAGTPTVQGAFYVYPATWSVAGGGGLQKSQGSQSLAAQWATNVASMSAPIAVFVRASDGRMLIQSRHAQLRGRDAIQGYQQQTIAGKAQRPTAISLEAFDWAFPLITVPPRATSVSSSQSQATTGSVGVMQPAGSQGTASCTWQFGQGSAAPAPPPEVIARAVPTAGAASVASPGGTPP
jgi:hypothetical protein